MATIFGIFNDPFGKPLTNVVIELTARKTTSVTFTGTNAAAVTAADGSYSMIVLPGVYAVTAKIKAVPDYLGVIQVYADSPDASLNQYLASFNPDDVTPAVLAEMQAILFGTLAAAKDAQEWAEKAESYALNYLGAYDPAVAYEKNDVVLWNGSEYKATSDVTVISPPESPWELFVSKGDDGEPGPANELAIGTVETLPAGSTATASITGAYPDQKLNLSLPAGEGGEPGPANELAIGTVETLPAGSPATASITGAYPGQKLNLSLPAGEGGEPGPANELAIGTVETLPAGSPATASITGAYPGQKLNLGIPEGKPGSSLVIPEFEGPGFIGFFVVSTASATSVFNPGEEVAASALRYGGVSDPAVYMLQGSNGPAGGTWRILGFAGCQSQPNSKAAMPFQRIDVDSYFRGGIEFSIQNCSYSKPDNSMIDCEIIVNGKKRPFSASASDITPWGREIFNNALAGEYGVVMEYINLEPE